MEIKKGDIVDVCDDSNCMVLENGKFEALSEIGGWLHNRNPFEVVGINLVLPSPEYPSLSYLGANDTMIKPVSGGTYVACTKACFLKKHVDKKQREVMENKKSSLEKWQGIVWDIRELITVTKYSCGYCENVSRDCGLCSLSKKGLCDRHTSIDSTIVRVLGALKEAVVQATILRKGIQTDILKNKED